MLQHLVKRAGGGTAPFKEHSWGCKSTAICTPSGPTDQSDPLF